MSMVCVVRISERSCGIGSRPNTSVKASRIMNTGMKAMAPSSCPAAFAPAHSHGPLDAFGLVCQNRCAMCSAIAHGAETPRDQFRIGGHRKAVRPPAFGEEPFFPLLPVVATKFHGHLGRVVAGTVPSVCLADNRYGPARLLLSCAADDPEQHVTPAHQRVARRLGADPVDEEYAESKFLHGAPTRTSMAAAARLSNRIAVTPGASAHVVCMAAPHAGDVGNEISEQHAGQVSTVWPLPNLIVPKTAGSIGRPTNNHPNQNPRESDVLIWANGDFSIWHQS
jgi:hypothetical protein